MDLKDLIVTPLTVLIIYLIAYRLRPHVTTSATWKYFLPGLTIKLVGAFTFGLIYQFYYQGGDTFNFFNQSSVFYDAFSDNIISGLKLLLATSEKYYSGTYDYITQLYWLRSEPNLFTIKITAVVGLISLNSYASISAWFAAFSFSGLWALYSMLTKLYSQNYLPYAVAILFLPSVIFWGSGLMKDTIMLGSLCWLIYSGHQLFILHKRSIANILILIGSAYVIYKIRIFILITLLPPFLLFIFLENKQAVKNAALKFLLTPLFIVIGIVGSYFITYEISNTSKVYNLESIGQYAKINSEYHFRHSLYQGGSAYTLGELDGTFLSMVRLTPEAINVTLFRPYLWESINLIMGVSAIESLMITLAALFVIFTSNPLQLFKRLGTDYLLQFCLIFSLTFAFAVGITSNNFGALVRYKILLMPFFLIALIHLRWGIEDSH